MDDHLTRTRLALLAAALACGACGSTSSDAPPPTHGASEQPVTEEDDAVVAASAGFDVHEWGLVDVALSGPVEIGAGPGQPSAPLSVRKPVVYVHADPGVALPPITVSARFPAGELLEHWPSASEWTTTRADAAGVTWPALTIGACEPGTAPASRGPSRELSACEAADGYCEVFDLPAYVASDASCLSSGGRAASLLFYRGRASAVTLPLRATASATSVSIESTMAGTWPVLHVREGMGSETPWPSPGAPTTLAPERALDGLALARRMHAVLIGAGLSQPEADAFLRAWSETLFGVGWPLEATREPTRDLPSRRYRAMPEVARPFLLYVMPEASVPALAELAITPTPRSVRRVMVVRVALAR